jgi:hypothetical protein
MNGSPLRAVARLIGIPILVAFCATVFALLSLSFLGCSQPRPDAPTHRALQPLSSPAASNPLSIEDAFAKGMQKAKSIWNLDGREYDASIKRATSGWSMTVTVYPRTWSSQMILGIDDDGKVTAITGF